MHLFKWTLCTQFSFIFSLSYASGGAKPDYCHPSMCPNQGKHIACGNTGDFSKNCIDEYHLEDMTPHIDLILQEHNMYRNYLASGNLNCYYAATRMPVLTWDWELADMAAYNVKTCVFQHDQCRSIPQNHYVGQNIYYARTTRTNLTVAQFITEACYLWFDEFMDADHTVMAKYRKTQPQSGHFTLLMNDRQNRVGCAFLNNMQRDKKDRRMVLFTCNYPSSNIRDLPSYKAGKEASDCVKRNQKYKSLCDDKIDPNDFYWYEN